MNQANLRKINAVLLFGFATIAALYYGASILIPFTFAAFLAALMTPVAGLFEKWRLGGGLSAFLCTLIVFVVTGGLSYIFFYQIRLFTNDLPLIKEELQTFLENMQQYFSSATGVSPEEQKEFIKDRSEPIINSAEIMATDFLGNLMNTTLNFLIVLVYLFLLLLYRKKFREFIMMYVHPEEDERAKKILRKSGKVVFHYLWGRIKVMTILAAMYLGTFLVFDVRYKILLTLFGALITIIPYIGPLISGLLPVCFVIIFGKSFSEVVLFSSIILIIQLIESYVLEPVIIGSEVKLNPLVVIIAIIIGGAIWGIAGMILFVPLFSILKIFFDNTPNLKPLGFLLGDNNKTSKLTLGKKMRNLFRK